MQLNQRAIAFLEMTTALSVLVLGICALPSESHYSLAQSNVERSHQKLQAANPQTAQDFFN